MSGGRCSLVWSNEINDVESILTLSDREFLERLQHRFGYRMGKFVKVGARNAYPLSLILAREVTSQRIALLGNAAHSIHPVAGQGFNLALRDVAALAQLLIDIGEQDAGNRAVLTEFAHWCQDDLKKTIRFTDGLARLFTNPLLEMTPLRGIGLVALDLLPPVRRVFARQTMGIAGRLTKLAVGQSLGMLPK
jgi:2-octaprenyl-6-methoxyphenol hydroxylase